ncbi:hypothetical protein HJ131_20930 [Vibrio parahaemolyticus]|uniref:hypothetical protein n=1 Tax=Vibrio parahaemolyticus TaxID=670 RepID=UPI001302E944|nr:hypothetical protein [Vibrio parahaemolyticus]MBE3994905.1 hypothetical protein [Vibrio parahaemolyticus]HAS6881994.1 hypothetical protein [Vibrio parahaemolyticus]
MDNLPSSDLIGYIIELEKFESTTLLDQVIERAKLAGFVSDSNSVENLSKLNWIKNVTQLAESSFNLQAAVDGELVELNMSTFKQLRQEREKRVNEVLELLARYIIDAAPPYKG